MKATTAMDKMSTHSPGVTPPLTPTNTTSSSSLTNTTYNTLTLDIHSLLHNDDISDILLVPEHPTTSVGGGGEEGGVPAVKAILAARSSVFRRMLYGKFRETQSNNQSNVVKVKLDYDTMVLTLLVEFCFTDQLASLDNTTAATSAASATATAKNNDIGDTVGKRDSVNTEEEGTNNDMLTNNNYNNSNNNTTALLINLEEKARLLTKLSGAAHYFDIPKLEVDVQQQLNGLMHTYPSLACAILDESSNIPSGDKLCTIAMSYIRARPKASLLHWNNYYYHTTTTNCCNNDGGVSNNSLLSSSSYYSSMKSSSSSYIDNNSELQPPLKNEDMAGGVISLNASLLEQVIFDEQSTANELTKFLCLQSWVNGCKHDVSASTYEGFIGDIIDLPRKQRGDDTDVVIVDDNNAAISLCKTSIGSSATAITASASSASVTAAAVLPINSSNEDQYEQRLLIAKHLSQKLDLSLIPASDLSTIITDSNLISTHDLYQAYRLQALNAERTKSKVFVEGAGLPEVNGTYLQRGVHEGTPMYNKEGVWRDREEIFRIFLCTYSNGNKSWCLSIVPKGREPGKTTDIDFYECPVSYGKTGPALPYGGGTGMM